MGGSIGGGLPNADWSDGEWLVVEADESDRSMLSLNVEIAVLTNVELDHHCDLRLAAELREAFRRVPHRPATRRDLGPARAARAAGRGRSSPYDADAAHAHGRGLVLCLATGRRCAWPFPGAHNALNAAGALEAARLAGAEPRARSRASRGFTGAARRFQLLGEKRARSAHLRRLRPPSDRDRGDARRGAHARAPAAGGRLPAPSLLAHRVARARVRPGAGARAT